VTAPDGDAEPTALAPTGGPPLGSDRRPGADAGSDPPLGSDHRPSADAASDRRLVVLDIDDTLYLERDYVRSGFTAVGEWARDELGVDDLGDRAWAAFESGVRRTIFDEALAACAVEPDPALVPRLVEVYRQHVPDIRMIEDARTWLDALAPHITVAVVTDGPLASQQAKADALGLSRWADHIVFTASLGSGRGKPHPAAFEHLEREVGLRAGRCAYVADNPAKDFVAPRRLGWRTVRVRRAGGLHATVLSGDDVEAEITGLDQLGAALAWDAPSQGDAPASAGAGR
jgi:putative hydrolase of the HAD superfamily